MQNFEDAKAVKLKRLEEHLDNIVDELEERLEKLAGGEMGLILIPFEILEPIEENEERIIRPVASTVAGTHGMESSVNIMTSIVAQYKSNQLLKKLLMNAASEQSH